MDADKACFSHYGKMDPAKTVKKEIDSLKRIIGGLTIANDILKNLGGKQKLSATKQMNQQVSPAGFLQYTGVSKCVWYSTPRMREVRLDLGVVDAVTRISAKKPTYGTRWMAAQVSRETGVLVNCKQIQRICQKMGYIEPQKTKEEVIRTKRRFFKPEAPNQLWGS